MWKNDNDNPQPLNIEPDLNPPDSGEPEEYFYCARCEGGLADDEIIEGHEDQSVCGQCLSAIENAEDEVPKKPATPKVCGNVQKLYFKRMRGHRLHMYPFKIGRNEKCPCGSGRKFKRCCINEARLETWKTRR